MKTELGVYRHYKGDFYCVLFVAHNANTYRDDIPVVVYVSLKTGVIYTRSEIEFHELVDDVFRFVYVGNTNQGAAT